MNCPVCSCPLIILELNQIEIDYCAGCQGIWLDEGELELLLMDSDTKKSFLDSFVVEKTSKEKSFKCPVCSKKMVKVVCGDESKVTLDRCPQQHGLWFNKGELQEVIEMGTMDKQGKIIKLLKEMFAHNLS